MILNQNERIILKVKHTLWLFFWPIVMCILLVTAGPFAGIPGIWLIYRIARYFTDECYITNQRFHVKTGILSKDEISTPLDKINNVYIHQGFIGKLCSYGDVVIQSAATIGAVKFAYASDPVRIKTMLDNTVEEHKNEQLKKQQEMLAQAIQNAKKTAAPESAPNE